MPAVEVDELQLLDALANIVTNAIEAMPAGGTTTIRTRKDHRRAIVEVHDTGIGMTEYVRRRCLEPFFSTSPDRHTGMGLSMVHGIVQRQNGTLDVISEPDKGTTLIIGLRLLVVDDTDRTEDVTPEAESTGGPLHILFVDDEEASRRVVARCTKTDKHTVDIAASGQECLEKFVAGEFDLIIVDRSMPSMSGDEVAIAIREQDSDVPIIMLTGFGEIMREKHELPSGVNLVVSKPVTRENLRQAIAQVTSTRAPS